MDTHGFPETLPFDVAEEAHGRLPAPRFTPVPMARNRRSGWTPKRQRAFIAALARWGSVSAAAREVGMSARGASRLLDRDGCESFARAWDRAVDLARDRLRADSLDRALHGSFVPVYRRGKLVRVEHRRSDRLAVSLLAIKGVEADDLARQSASRRAALRKDFRDLDAANAALAEAREATRQAIAKEVAACDELNHVRVRHINPRVYRL